MKKRPSYTKEFKLEAVRLLERGDKPAADLARELGVPRNKLYVSGARNSAQRDSETAFPGSGVGGSGTRRLGAPAAVSAPRSSNTLLFQHIRAIHIKVMRELRRPVKPAASIG